ncbi:GNAT family N-acetyltransferase [Azohydromonas lata]
MGLLKAYRGQSLGKQLLEACIVKALQNGLTQILSGAVKRA